MTKVTSRKIVLLIHVSFVFAWIGTVIIMTALSFLSDRRENSLLEILFNFLLTPVSIISMATGMTLAFIGKWGLTRYYWILVKLMITMLLMLAINIWIRIALIISPDHNSSIAGLLFTLLMLLITVTISFKKPWGRITRTERNKAA